MGTRISTPLNDGNGKVSGVTSGVLQAQKNSVIQRLVVEGQLRSGDEKSRENTPTIAMFYRYGSSDIENFSLRPSGSF